MEYTVEEVVEGIKSLRNSLNGIIFSDSYSNKEANAVLEKPLTELALVVSGVKFEEESDNSEFIQTYKDFNSKISGLLAKDVFENIDEILEAIEEYENTID